MHDSLPQALIVLWLNFVLQVVPVRLVSTFTELLMGVLISGSGHVTDALFQVGHRKHFTTYYWFLNHGKWSWFKVNQQLIKLIVTYFPRIEWNIIVDDFAKARTGIFYRILRKRAFQRGWIYI